MSEHEKKVAKLIQKAQKDPAVKAALLKDPNGTVEAEFKVTLPKGLTVAVVEDTDSVVHFVLPMDYRLKGKAPENNPLPEAADEAAKKRWAVIQKAWGDAAFKAKLLKDPKGVLAKEGALSAQASVKVLEDTEERVHLVLPRL